MQIPQWVVLTVQIFCSSAAVATVAACWQLFWRISRDEAVKRDFPPHRHINGKIIYPREYEPAAVERLNPGN